MRIDDDLGWYLDNIVVPGRPAKLGPAREQQHRWALVAEALRNGSPAEVLAVGQGFVLTHAQARGAGVGSAEVRRHLRAGRWTAPRRNALCVLPRPQDDRSDPHGERVETAAAALVLVRPDSVVSHASAAAMHGLPLLSSPPRPTVTIRFGNGGGQNDALVHAAALHADEIACWFGLPVTCVARTVVDVARNSGAGAGLVVADAALREDLTTTPQLDAAVARAAHWPGVRAARIVVGLASPRAESPLESLTRLLMHERGLPLPELQMLVSTAGGTFRVDGLWRERRVVLEVDGMLKYRSPEDLVREKRRQEHLERAGYRVVRVTWDDVMFHPALTAARIAEALRAGGRCFGIG